MEYSLVANVNAPPEVVWPLLVNVERWPTMTASIIEVRRLDTGPLRIGSEAILSQPRLLPARWRVVDLVPGRSFVWETKSAGLIISGGHLVETRGAGASISLTLGYRGPLAGVVNAALGNLIQKYLAMELEGFRRTAELPS